MNNTIVSLRKSNYEKYSTRKRVFVPADAVAPVIFSPANHTTTTYLAARGSSYGTQIRKIKSSGLYAPIMDTLNLTVAIPWRVPDDFYPGEKTHVRLVFAKYNTTTSTSTFAYTVVYNTKHILDYNNKGTATEEIITAVPATALSTALGETLTFDDDTIKVQRFSPYRGMRGTINAGLIEKRDFVDFLVTAGAQTQGASIALLGLEIDYEVGLRGSVDELYKD